MRARIGGLDGTGERMRSMIAIGSVLLWVAGCAGGPSTMPVEWKINPAFDFAGKSRFRFGPEKNENPSDPNATWVQQRNLVRTLIREELAAKGYREDEANADFVVQFYVGTTQRGTMYYYRDAERKGEVDIHMSLSESDPWVWHGWASKTETQGLDVDAAIRQAVQLILERMPPAS